MLLKKKKYFFFPKLQKKYLLFLFFFIAACCKKGIQIFLEDVRRIEIEFLKLYIYDVGDMLTIIPFIIMKNRSKSERENQDITINKTGSNLEYIYNDLKDYQKICSTYRKIIIFTIIDFIAQISTVIYYIIIAQKKVVNKLANLNSVLIFNIFSVILFSIVILGTKFYKHHLFAILIDVLCLIILTITDIIIIYEEGDNKSLNIIFLFIRIFSEILYSLENVIGKKLFLYYYLSTFSLLVNKSIFHFFYLIIFSLPFIFIKLDDKNGESKIVFYMIHDIFRDKIYYLIVIGYTISSFFFNNLCFKIIDEFSPNHFVISRIFEYFGIFIIDLITNGLDSELYLIIRIIMFILLILSSFIYNEFLVINICDLAKNTKLFLDYEANNEIPSIITEMKDDISISLSEIS